MACYNPLKCYEGKKKKNGKTSIVWRRSNSWKGEKLNLPCGKCDGCLHERARQWSVRCMHEASLYEDNCFITLTYSDENLPYGNSLDKTDFQLFMKRLRKNTGEKIRYYMVGEYGEKFERPHYHALIFNYDFDDKILYSEINGNRLYISETLSKLWPHGFSTIGSVSIESSAYVARYVLKKLHLQSMSQEEKDIHYGGREPEYSTMSRRPGIGYGWYKKYKSDVFPSDEIIVKGKKQKVPRFYDKLLEKEDEKLYKSIKEKRKKLGMLLVPMELNGKTIFVDDNDSFRLPIKEVCFKASKELYKRPLEEI